MASVSRAARGRESSSLFHFCLADSCTLWQDCADVAGREYHRVSILSRRLLCTAALKPLLQGFFCAGAYVVLVIHGHLIDMLLKALLGIVPQMQSNLL